MFVTGDLDKTGYRVGVVIISVTSAVELAEEIRDPLDLVFLLMTRLLILNTAAEKSSC